LIWSRKDERTTLSLICNRFPLGILANERPCEAGAIRGNSRLQSLGMGRTGTGTLRSSPSPFNVDGGYALCGMRPPWTRHVDSKRAEPSCILGKLPAPVSVLPAALRGGIARWESGRDTREFC
jgi:hypothetical protein